ncbi:MAG: P-loop NTPase fold protein [Phycisphaerae bacterium]
MAQKKEEFQKFAAREPELTVLTDHALKPKETYRDSFNLRFRLGPVYDILRYPGTKTPMAIAVYGDWGAGKTTAMKWLHGLIEAWNENDSVKDKIKVRPIWFYPWKYDNKEDVWRGLIAEVIWKAIDIKTASVRTVTEAFKMLGMFIGKSAIDIISAVKMNMPGFEISGEAIKQIAEDFKEASHPEKQYLNQYEDALKRWVEKSLGEKQRMVIFIDDLDRCMPEIALQVLEALKLYLNIEKLFFVVGVDRKVVDKLVKEHYKRLGLDEEKSGNYLAKMFQVEVQVEPSEQQISDFLDEELKEISYWREPYLSKNERGIFRELIFKLAERNPREVKRLINSALMMGGGAVMMKSPDEKQGGIKFNQGLQLFFVRKILDDRYTIGSLVGSERGNDFFRQWSEIVFEGKKDNKDFPCTVKVPEDFGKEITEEMDLEEKTQRRWEKISPTFAPEKYHELLKNLRFSGILRLLGDEDLGQLMRIRYPSETQVAEIAAVVGTSKDEDIIREGIARQLGKKPDKLRKGDYNKIKELDLSGSEISDLEPIKGLSSLEQLTLRSTQVRNLEPIKRLSSLQWLDLAGTKVSDLEPIKGLRSLQVLFLNNTQVSNLEPIKGISSLEWLYLEGTQVSDQQVEELQKALPKARIFR